MPIIFYPGGSFVNQLLSITHDIYKSFDISAEVRAGFLHTSEAFFEVWHNGLVVTLKQPAASDDLPRLLKQFLANRKQRVLLNDQYSSHVDIKEGFPITLLQ